MITNESEIRVALQAVLASVLALYGFWGCAFLVVLVLLPWKPICAAAFYLAQPLVDWRMRKALREPTCTPLERPAMGAVRSTKDETKTRLAGPVSVKVPTADNLSRQSLRAPFDAFKANLPTTPSFHPLPGSAQRLAATVAIPPAIKEHVRNLPQGAFNNMDLEVEDVKFQGDTAEAWVRFQSPHVPGLSIRQRYILRRHRGAWQVESRQPANGCGKTPPHSASPDGLTMRLT